jgi:hypothetical protein
VLPLPGVLSTPTFPPISSRQAAGDGQAETGAAVLAGGRAVGLLEGVEQAAILSGAMPMPVSVTSKRTSRLSRRVFKQPRAQGD